MQCEFCGITETEGEFQIDQNKGFWCEDCDGYNYFHKHENKHKFKLILEDKIGGSPMNKTSDIKFSKRLSPYRYPGGKTRVVDHLYTHLQKSKTNKLVSPFTGGGSFELALLDSGVINKLHLNDLDTGVFSLWWTIKHFPDHLIFLLETITPTHRDFFEAQSVIKNDYKGRTITESAWASLLVNRLAFSGIAKSNPLGGKKGDPKKLLSRWNPEDLIKRIKKVNRISNQIEITQENAVDLIEESYWSEETTIFIDPPYVEKGKDLYYHYYKNKDHIELSNLLDSLYRGMPGADIIVTYDYNEWLEDLYMYPETEKINRKYSA